MTSQSWASLSPGILPLCSYLQVAPPNLLPQLSLHCSCNLHSSVAFQPEMQSSDLASQQLALEREEAAASCRYTGAPRNSSHLQVSTLLPGSLLQLAFLPSLPWRLPIDVQASSATDRRYGGFSPHYARRSTFSACRP